MLKTALAELMDVARISTLLLANSADQGGMLLGHWSPDVIRDRISNKQLIVMVTEGDQLLGVLLTQDNSYGDAPPVRAMLTAWPGSPDAYVYGPVCIAEQARGRGVLRLLYAQLRRVYPSREAILFVREDNPRSLKAHMHLGMREVARYQLNGATFIVLSDRSDLTGPPPGPSEPVPQDNRF
jgi:ribosomal protein S18 acetylase RimI-like enzyme